ncbi:uncharacterized protein NECHADRAFT_87178 [Fusarium vanettenii 77-13-4]|uniref:C2H2-type domain-containing protein n=1 Tax=Fusarium vanettenii (strain ATCC MYA-4622 / CBS 123669 / FGSC 9596 / NRRL 45880 / 77-13-4) TaxID=660122 RepID=C7ZIK7_FUSV7|nr:uncharacterized protein NECHADRAFT_87178 [Fusarium vanettenii 77-13-4]EEU36106.1 hypothetical protein NECHADRAFT_87178 [Fusarium vanettenii 77-13-4]
MTDQPGDQVISHSSSWIGLVTEDEGSVGKEPEDAAKVGDADYVVSSSTARGNAFSRFKHIYGGVPKSKSEPNRAMSPMHSTPFGMPVGFDTDHVQVWKGFQQVDRLDEPMSKGTPTPGRYESVSSMMSGTTYVSAKYNPLEHNVFELPDVPYNQHSSKNTDEGPLFRAYFSDAHSVLQTTSQIRQLIVSLNPYLRDSNAFLTDRIAYHYATQVYKLEWQHPFLGITGPLESSFFHPFICTWKSCRSIKAFHSLSDLIIHMDAVHKRQQISKMRLLHPPHQKLLLCNFCDSRYADFNFLDTHVATHMVEIGQAFLNSAWRDFEADPGASLGIWQKKPAELDNNPEPPQAKLNPPPKEKFPYGGLFPRVGIETSVPKPRPQRAKTPHQELFSLITPPPVPEAPKAVSPPRTKTPHQDLFSPITPKNSIPESPKVVSPLRARTPHHYLVSSTTPKELASVSPKIVSPKKEKVTDVVLPPPAKLNDPVLEISAPVSTNLPETPPPQKPSFKQIGMATVEVKMVLSTNATRKTAAGGDESDTDESESSESSEAGDAEHGTWSGTGMGQGWVGAPGSGQQAPWAGPSTPSNQSAVEGGDGGRTGKKRRKGDGPASVMGSRPRFACPYRVFEPDALNCLERGPKNPLGGCEDISRLKQHLGRRHKRSRRCNRCLKAFESDAKARTHESLAACPVIPLPDFERLMSAAHESITERFSTPMSDLAGWWFIFKLLIPGMQDRDSESLKLEYSPYYVHRAPAIMLPAMNFSASILDSAPADVFPNPLDQMVLGIDANAATSTFVSQHFSVPVFQVPDSLNPGNIPEITISAGVGSFSGASSEQSNPWTPPRPSTPATSTAPSASSRSAPGSVAGSTSQTQLERNHMRLKSQYKQVEKENAKLREDKYASRGDLERAEAVLEEVLGSADLSQDAFDNLSQVSDILMEMKRRLG